jgi:hypothetical protein
MSEEIGIEKERKHFIRGDFTLLLFLGTHGFIFWTWFIIWMPELYSTTSRYIKAHLGESLLVFIILPYVLTFIATLFIMQLSVLFRIKWWNAIILTFFLLGTPFISWILTLIGTQIARLFYIPTVTDLSETKKSLLLTVKPRKKYIAIYEQFMDEQPYEKPYYFSIWQSTLSALFGGFLGGGLLLSVNYKQLGDKKRFAIGLTASMLLQFILILVIYAFLELNEQVKFIYLFPFLLFIPALTNLLYKEFLQEKIATHVSAENLEKAPWWSVFCVFLITLMFLFFCHDPVVLILQAFGLTMSTLLL